MFLDRAVGTQTPSSYTPFIASFRRWSDGSRHSDWRSLCASLSLNPTWSRIAASSWSHECFSKTGLPRPLFDLW